MFFEELLLPLRKKAALAAPPVPNTGWRPPGYYPNLHGATVIGFDVETYDPELTDKGPGWARGPVGYICGISIAAIMPDGRRGKWYFPVAHTAETHDNLDAKHTFAWLKEMLETPHTPKCGANLLYDIGWLTEYNIEVMGPLYDVQVAEALLNESGEVNLDYLGEKYLGQGKETSALYTWCAQAFGGSANGAQRANIWRTPPRLAGPYAEADADMPLDIFDKQRGLLEMEGLTDLFRLECDLIPMLVQMRCDGVAVNVPGAEKMADDLMRDSAAAKAALNRQLGFECNVNAAESVARAFDIVGIPYKKTATGKPSFGKDFLKNTDHDVARAINTIRELEKLCGTFVQGYILDGNVKGKIHGSFNPLRADDGGTRTGRMSSSNPNLQNIPVRSALGGKIRTLFTPDSAHFQWRKYDYCLAPHANVLTADMRHVPASSVKVGDIIVGFDEHASDVNKGEKSRRLMRKTKVVAVKWLQQPARRIHFASGAIIDCSASHRWLAKSGYSHTYDYVQTDKLQSGYMVPRVCNVWQPDTSYDAGWLAGMFDGEGWRVNGLLGIAQNPGPVLDRIKTLLIARGVAFKEVANPKSDVITLQIQGGRLATWQLLGEVRPVRLLAKNAELIDGFALQSRTSPADIVTRVEDMGIQWVVAIETDCRTLIVEGLASHNSQIEYRFHVHYAIGPGSDDVRARFCNDPDTDYHVLTQLLVQEQTGQLIERKPIKNINFGLLYGMGQSKLARQLGLDADGAKALFAAYHAGNPYTKATMDEFAREAQRLGYITTILGRRRRFNLWEPLDINYDNRAVALPYHDALRHYGSNIQRAHTHKAVNSRYQGSAADQMKAGMLGLWRSGVLAEIGCPRLTVHDELDFSQHDGSERSIAAFAFVQNTMEQVIQLRIPVKADCSYGATWGDAK